MRRWTQNIKDTLCKWARETRGPAISRELFSFYFVFVQAGKNSAVCLLDEEVFLEIPYGNCPLFWYVLYTPDSCHTDTEELSE